MYTDNVSLLSVGFASAEKVIFIYSIPIPLPGFFSLYFDRRGRFRRGAGFVKSTRFINTIFDTGSPKTLNEHILPA